MKSGINLLVWIAVLTGLLATPRIANSFSGQTDSESTQVDEKIFASDQGGFQIRMTKPNLSVRKIQPKAGAHVELFLFKASSNENQSAQTVSYHDLRKPPGGKQEIKEILDNSASGFSKSIKGKIGTDKALEISGLPARQIAFETTSYDRKIRGVTQFVLRKNRVYQITFVAARDKFDEQSAKSFLGSFRLIKIQKRLSDPSNSKSEKKPTIESKKTEAKSDPPSKKSSDRSKGASKKSKK